MDPLSPIPAGMVLGPDQCVHQDILIVIDYGHFHQLIVIIEPSGLGVKVDGFHVSVWPPTSRNLLGMDIP